MDTQKVLKTIKDTGIIAIARGIYGDDLMFAARALYEGGVRAFEVTFEQGVNPLPTLYGIGRLFGELPMDCVIGAGTVLSVEQVRHAHKAGAAFIISPNTSREVIEKTKEYSMISIPGAMTPTEICEAFGYGADIVKVFPAGTLGVEYFKAIKAPLQHIPMAAVAGITKNNIAAFRKAGAAAFGISSSLFIKKAIEERDADLLRNNAAEFLKAMND